MRNLILFAIMLTVAVTGCESKSATAVGQTAKPSVNKQTVQRYMDEFAKLNHAGVLECLTEDVVWDIPGAFNVTGKAAFDNEIENDAFVGKPTIKVTRMTEENGVVVAEGSVQCARKAGGMLNAV